jgi:outer membrane protein assembly factor BamB
MRWLYSLGLFVACGVVTATTTFADFQDEYSHNWHQWRGPEANGVAPHGDPPVQWSEDANIQWKTAIPGRGSGSPVVWGDRVFLLSALKTDRNGGTAALAEPKTPPAGQRFGRFLQPQPTNIYQFIVLCLDRSSGKVLWQRVAHEAVPHEPLHMTNTHASSSPTTDGKFLYVSFGSFGIYCYDLDGNLKWTRDFGEMKTRRGFGEGASPVLHNGTLIVNWDHEGPSFIVALNAATGKTKWKRDRQEVTTWNTPLVVEAAGRTQVIVNATQRSRSYDLDTGELIWQCGGQFSNPIASPVAHDNLVYCMTGHKGHALYAIPLDSSGDITGSEKIAWHRDEGTPYIPSPLLYDGLLYFTKGRNAILSCLNAVTGEPIIDQKRLPKASTFYASPVGASGRIYLSSRKGTTIVLKKSDLFEVLATNELDEPLDASPAVVDKQLFLRGDKHLYCIAEE